MLYLGELYKRLKLTDDQSKRIKMVQSNMNGPLRSFLTIISEGKTEWSNCLKGRPILFEDNAYGRTISNFYREFEKILYFRKEVGNNIPVPKLIDMYERVQMQLHREESELLADLINGTLVWPQSNEEIKLVLGVKK